MRVMAYMEWVLRTGIVAWYGTSLGLPRQEGVYATLNDVPVNWAKVPGIEGARVRVRHHEHL